MPVLIPVVAAWAGSAAAGAFAATAIGGAMVAAIGSTLTGVIVGAVVGAAVGALGAAVMGEDIGKYALYGAIGGAVAGGITGYSAGSADTAISSGASDSVDTSLPSWEDGVAEKLGSDSTTSLVDTSTTSKGLLSGIDSGDLLSLGGTAAKGYYDSKTAKENNEADNEQADKARKETFEAQLEQIAASHSARLAEIGSQNGTQLELADKNNAAAMAQLQTRIGADKDAVTSANEREDLKRDRFNESVIGVDSTLFERPTLSFDSGRGDTEFDSGIDNSSSSQQARPSRSFSAEEIALNKKKSVA